MNAATMHATPNARTRAAARTAAFHTEMALEVCLVRAAFAARRNGASERTVGHLIWWGWR